MTEFHVQVHRLAARLPLAKTTYRFARKVISQVTQDSRVSQPKETDVESIIGGDYYFSHKGYCACCDRSVVFTARDSWLRDNYLCTSCQSIPRERALMTVLEEYYPNWKDMKIHESSPSSRGASPRLKNKAKHYKPTQYFPNHKFGAIVDGFRNEDLEKQTFKDKSFDLVVTLDVIEHIYNPKKVFQEVARTLKTGGAYIFTVPMINKHMRTEIWAKKSKDGAPIFLHEPERHLNPVDVNGSPVTMHWGYDIVGFIKKSSGLNARIIAQYDKNKGIMGEYNEVIVATKDS